MPAMLLSKEEWNEVRSASESGCEDEQLSQDYGIPKATIRKRRQREGWLTPARIQAEVEAQRARTKAMKQGNKGALISGDVTRVTKQAEQSVAAAQLAQSRKIGGWALDVAQDKMERVFKNPSLLDDLCTMGDVVSTIKLARMIAGEDKQEPSLVQVNFHAPVEGGVIDV